MLPGEKDLGKRYFGVLKECLEHMDIDDLENIEMAGGVVILTLRTQGLVNYNHNDFSYIPSTLKIIFDYNSRTNE